MGSIYKQKGSNHWWIKYYRNGCPIRETTESTKESEAIRILKLREGDVARGVPLTTSVGKIRFEEMIMDLISEYEVNGRKSLYVLKIRCNKHLLPFFF
jgi:hypothetical protein